MALVIVKIPGKVISDAQQARLIAVGLPVLVLPWWPSEVEESGWAPNYAETERPGRTALLTRSNDPLATLRISFVLRASDVTQSIQDTLDIVRRYAAAKPIVQVMLGQSDRGHWRITDAGATQQDWAANGEPSVADVVISMREASDASIPVGPIKKKPKS
jgi:hypothetical protein